MRTVVDISTALRWTDKNAVGIVRTEREIARYLLLNADTHHVELIYFDREGQDFRRVTRLQIISMFPEFEGVAQSKAADAPEFNALFIFADKDTLISAGLQWDIDFLSAIYLKKKKQRIRLVQVIYDVIPILMPEYCVPGMDILFPKFIMDAAWTADVIYAISESTKIDFITYAGQLQISRIPPVRKINLGCDIPIAQGNKTSNFGLHKNEFVLYVSTIEPRKNHKMLFDIWRQLSVQEGLNLPKLIFVGNEGWNMENLVTSIESCPKLHPEKISILSNVTDKELEWLYTNAMFSIYPSLYEGWGLPIAESLARGTPCISSSSSSMPEVAGTFCDLIDPYDYVSWKKTIARYITDPNIISSKKKYIQENYQIETWSMAIAKFKADLDALPNDWMS
ncbi:glycosyltransferase family 4 protein [uncultured Methylobacterium sp.]|uniref:glycosyltransferase family 4 protein n=1 Tax=uncultured Methylobacterium sp. TaxID=157278 RepID=UPI0035C9F1AB